MFKERGGDMTYVNTGGYMYVFHIYTMKVYMYIHVEASMSRKRGGDMT